MNERIYKIISLRNCPRYSERAIDWFASKWGIDRKEYEKSIDDCIHNDKSLPQWYLAMDETDEIVGGCGLIQNDFVDRTDLFPYLCALFVEEKARGNAIGARLLENARIDAGRLGFDKVYLCTDHTSYYEKYGWKYIAIGRHPWGDTSRIYEAPAIKKPSLEKMSDFFTVQTMHHFSHAEKVGLYTKICNALKEKGVYIECDYVVTEQSAEDELFAQNARLRRELNIPDGEFYHFDTPLYH